MKGSSTCKPDHEWLQQRLHIVGSQRWKKVSPAHNSTHLPCFSTNYSQYFSSDKWNTEIESALISDVDLGSTESCLSRGQVLLFGGQPSQLVLGMMTIGSGPRRAFHPTHLQVV